MCITRRARLRRHQLLHSGTMDHHITIMCGRVIQSSAPMRYAIVDGVKVRDSRVHNYPPRWNGAPSQDQGNGVLARRVTCRSRAVRNQSSAGRGRRSFLGLLTE